MVFKRLKYPVAWKSLIHFDFPYPDSIAAAATNAAGGLRDEIGINTWTPFGTCLFVGTEAPAVVVAGTPKFGWRCVQFAGVNDYIKADNVNNIWDLKAKGRYEFDFFIRPISATAGKILTLRSDSDELFSLAMDSANHLTLTVSAWSILATSSGTLNTNVFNYVTVRISGEHVSVYANGTEMISIDIGTDAYLQIQEARLGGFNGQINEFRFMHSATAGIPTIPTKPHQGALDLSTVGYFGDGTYGDAHITTSGNVQINSYAPVTAITESSMTIGTTSAGLYGSFTDGDEIMILLSQKKGTTEGDLGKYAIRRIQSFSGGVIGFDKPLAGEFDTGNAVQDYKVQVIKIPNYGVFTLSAATTIVPLTWNDSVGGIVALKVQGNCTIDGKILTAATGPVRVDGHNLAHSDLIERFILTGNVFLLCGGRLQTGDDTRIGALYAGDGTGRVGFGEVGAQGGGGSYSGAGGAGGPPGLAGIGGNGGTGTAPYTGAAAGGGGGAGGNMGQNGANGGTKGGTGKSPPNVIICAAILSVSGKSISTGGGKGGNGGSGMTYDNGNTWFTTPANISASAGSGCGYGGGGGSGGASATGGGGGGGGGAGTGFCFLAYGEVAA
jgi:hypothetical protein